MRVQSLTKNCRWCSTRRSNASPKIQIFEETWLITYNTWSAFRAPVMINRRSSYFNSCLRHIFKKYLKYSNLYKLEAYIRNFLKFSSISSKNIIVLNQSFSMLINTVGHKLCYQNKLEICLKTVIETN